MAWVEIRYKEDPLNEEKTKRLEGKEAGYNIDDLTFGFVKIWADKQTFAVLKEKVSSIEHSAK